MSIEPVDFHFLSPLFLYYSNHIDLVRVCENHNVSSFVRTTSLVGEQWWWWYGGSTEYRTSRSGGGGGSREAAQASTSITTTILSIKHGIRSNFNGVVPIIAYIVLFLLVAHDALSQQKQT